MMEGYVAHPGRYPLVSKDPRLLDLVATSGGFTTPPEEITLRVTRGDSSMEVSASSVINNPANNVLISPGDTILALHAPVYYYAFGAVGHTGQQVFDQSHPKLLNALGKISNIQDERADAGGVFIFRNEPAALKQQLVGSVEKDPQPKDQLAGPVVYQLNMRDPNSFLVLNAFPVRPSDIIYVANAPLVEFGKFVRIVTGLTSAAAGPLFLTQ
jgi:polysaccharide export outer membrane protein